MKTITNIVYPAFVLFAFTCFAFSPQARAVGNAAIRDRAGFSVSTAGNVACLGANVFGPNLSVTGLIGNASATELLRKQIAGSRPRQLRQAFNLGHGKIDPDNPAVNTIPHWSDSFTYNGLVYTYTMVGTDPRRGSATTVVPTVLIPLRFVFADGNVFDASTDIIGGQTPVQGIINSPIFQNYNFNNTSVRVGNTQYGDAFQRANFWNSVSTRSPNYHVLLGQPTVAPTQTINVPQGLFSYLDDGHGHVIGVVDYDFLSSMDDHILSAGQASPDMLPIIVWGRISTTVFGAYHRVTSLNGNGLQTYIATGYKHSSFFGPDVASLSHEIVEWMDDPFLNNFTPGWDIPFVPPADRCDSLTVAGDGLEVADPMEFFLESIVPLPGETFTYHVVEAMFIDFFTRASRSRSYNGQYSLFEIGLPHGLLTGPSAPCTGHVEFAPTYVDFPGATFTAVTGLNRSGLATGVYVDTVGAQHGFTFNGSNYSTLDYPGSLLTNPSKINDAGTIVGSFVDASGGTHGFSYQSGQWRQIDFPGAFDTQVSGINAAGDMVGLYDGTQPVTHAFLLRNGQYQRIDTPFGTQANAFAINDLGSITGIGYTDPFFGPFTSFIFSHNNLSSFQFPGSILSQLFSINNSNDLAGIFFDPDGTRWGMVTVGGNPYMVYNAVLFGNDQFDRISGYTFDDTGRPRGLIGTLPLQRSP